jgi:hypothetical protein
MQERQVVHHGLKKALTIMCLLYPTRTLKLCAIGLKMVIKCKNDKFLDKAQKTSPTVTRLWNHTATPKPWEIALFYHETVGEPPMLWFSIKLSSLGGKTFIKLINDEFFWHVSKTCTNCEWPCKLLRMLKIVGNSSQNAIKCAKRWVFLSWF